MRSNDKTGQPDKGGSGRPLPRRVGKARGRKAAPKRTVNPGAHHQGWMTPKPIADALEWALGMLGMDPCSGGEGKTNIHASVHYVEDPRDPLGGGLEAAWTAGSVYINPPYKGLRPWTAKALASVRSGDAGIVVALLPVRTDPLWYRESIAGKAHLLLLPKRLRFDVAPGVPGEHTADFPCMLVVWGGTRSQVERLRGAFPDADFRPAPSYWQPCARAGARARGTARSRAATATRAARGGAVRQRSPKGGR